MRLAVDGCTKQPDNAADRQKQEHEATQAPRSGDAAEVPIQVVSGGMPEASPFAQKAQVPRAVNGRAGSRIEAAGECRGSEPGNGKTRTNSEHDGKGEQSRKRLNASCAQRIQYNEPCETAEQDGCH